MSNDPVLLHGDSLDILKDLPDNSVDSIVTDPPYGLSFMGKKWDYDVPSVDIWKEALRVLKPGGHLLSFGGTRTYHRMVVNIEDAGFEIRDQVMWLYGSGFPKSMDVSKAIDKAAGAEREVVAEGSPFGRGSMRNKSRVEQGYRPTELNPDGGISSITAPSTPEAKQWEGWGTALKPANEPICVARKPLEKGLTVAANVLKWGTGAINIDASRICCKDGDRTEYGVDGDELSSPAKNTYGQYDRQAYVPDSQGRWPANLILDEEAAKVLDEQSGILSPGHAPKKSKGNPFGGANDSDRDEIKYEKGGASRFFYVAKASKRERGDGNVHPTVKPIKLMEYLIKLITPPGGIVLDPFMGSGTTGVAAISLGFEFIGIEREEAYFNIAEGRITAA